MKELVRVLLVDDHPFFAAALAEILGPDDGFEFHHCEHWHEALPEARAVRPAAILQDLVMPDGDGMDLLAAYRGLEAFRHRPVIILSGQDCGDRRAEAIARGATDYLVKPPHPGELRERLRSHVRTWRLLVEAGVATDADAGVRPQLRSRTTAVPERIGPVTIERVLARGATGVAVLGHHRLLDMPVVVKLVDGDGNRSRPSELLAEGRLAARLNHPAIVRLYEVGELDGGTVYMVYEYCAGGSLADALVEGGRLSVARSISVLGDILAGLQELHGQGLIHRDIKPANVLLSPQGRAKVADLGLARRLDDGGTIADPQVVGTPYYVAPEVVSDRTADQRSDLYSLGALAYHCLAGRPPFVGGHLIEVLDAHVHDQPEPLTELRADLPVDLADFCHRLLEKDPGRRFSAASVARAALCELSHEKVL